MSHPRHRPPAVHFTPAELAELKARNPGAFAHLGVDHGNPDPPTPLEALNLYLRERDIEWRCMAAAWAERARRKAEARREAQLQALAEADGAEFARVEGL